MEQNQTPVNQSIEALKISAEDTVLDFDQNNVGTKFPKLTEFVEPVLSDAQSPILKTMGNTTIKLDLSPQDNKSNKQKNPYFAPGHHVSNFGNPNDVSKANAS